MDVREQLQRLIDLAEDTRRRAARLTESGTEAMSQLDTAQYDLQRIVEEIRELLPDGAGVPPSSADQSAEADLIWQSADAA